MTRWLSLLALWVSGDVYEPSCGRVLIERTRCVAGMQAVDSIPTLRQLAVDVAAGRTQPLDLPGFHRHVMAAR
jgi:hypothetical protein